MPDIELPSYLLAWMEQKPIASSNPCQNGPRKGAIWGLYLPLKKGLTCVIVGQMLVRPSETVEPQWGIAVRFPHIPANLFRRSAY